jgi:FKBP-type peptidyl-prolyl cis-trans isomerase
MLLVALCALAQYVNVTADGKVRKCIIEHGTSPQTPVNGQVVRISYVGKLTNGITFDSSKSIKTGVLTFVIGVGVIHGWNIVLKTMQIGERAIVQIEHEYGYGARGVPPIVPSNADLIYEMQLITIE